MKILEVSISEYKCLKDQTISFEYDSIYPRGSQIIGIIGGNGCGKTTLCSALAKIFESFISLKNTQFDYSIRYKVGSEIKKVEKIGDRIEYYTHNELVHSAPVKNRNPYAQRRIHRQFIETFWHGKVILSTFETSGEYPKKKTSKYIGVDPVMKYDTKDLYGKNMYGFPSLTNGILNFISDPRKHKLAKTAFAEMKLEYCSEVEVRLIERLIRNIGFRDYYKDTERGSYVENYYDEDEDYAEFVAYLESGDSKLKIIPDNQIISTGYLMELFGKFPTAFNRLFYVNGMVFKKNELKVNFEKLSSGEKFFIARYLSIASSIAEDSVVFIEEPESHLNPSWREIFIPVIHDIASKFNSSVIFTTHDYRSIRMLHNNNVKTIKDGILKSIETPTILCDEFDFEQLNGKIIELVFGKIKQHLEKADSYQKLEFLNSICRVPEKFNLAKEYFGEKYDA